MGLSALLRQAQVPKGSFYHYFRSKEAFGVAMLEHAYQQYHAEMDRYFAMPGISPQHQVYAWYQQQRDFFQSTGQLRHCLVVKLSAEVCDLSEDMRFALSNGSAQMITKIANVLDTDPESEAYTAGHHFGLATLMYTLWLGACLQAKLTRQALPLELALAHIATMIKRPVE